MSVALISLEVFLAGLLLVIGWAVLSCLRMFARETAYREAHHNLLVQAQIIRLEHVPKFRQVQRDHGGSANDAKQAVQASEVADAQKMAA